MVRVLSALLLTSCLLAADSLADGKRLFAARNWGGAVEALERATAESPSSSEAWHWLGKAQGRRAENANPLMAPRYAGKARDAFEKAVQLNPRNLEAVSDLFSYYMEAPGFLGGGTDKAKRLADSHIQPADKAEYQYALAKLAEDRKDWTAAERHYRSAMQLAPASPGRAVDVAKFLSKRGRAQDAETMFAEIANKHPNNPRVVFERAANLVRSKQNPELARTLLQQYMKLPIGIDDPPRSEAQKLLKSVGA